MLFPSAVNKCLSQIYLDICCTIFNRLFAAYASVALLCFPSGNWKVKLGGYAHQTEFLTFPFLKRKLDPSLVKLGLTEVF